MCKNRRKKLSIAHEVGLNLFKKFVLAKGIYFLQRQDINVFILFRQTSLPRVLCSRDSYTLAVFTAQAQNIIENLENILRLKSSTDIDVKT